MEEKIQNEPWYHEIAGELRQYKKYKARIGVLEARMIRQTGPVNNLSARYGEDGATVEDTDEEELERLKIKVASIEFALGALTTTERKIIELKFFERRKNVLIYDMDLPMAPNTFYKELDSAMKTIRKIIK